MYNERAEKEIRDRTKSDTTKSPSDVLRNLRIASELTERSFNGQEGEELPIFTDRLNARQDASYLIIEAYGNLAEATISKMGELELEVAALRQEKADLQGDLQAFRVKAKQYP